jgi:single-strand DNA-binding protein
MYNFITLVGRLGADPDVKETTKGDSYASLSLATNERYKAKDGDYKEKTQWHKVMVFNPQVASSLAKYMKKGDTIIVQGQVEYRSYENDGITKYVTEIVVPRFSGKVQLIPMNKGNGQPAKDSASTSAEPTVDIPF